MGRLIMYLHAAGSVVPVGRVKGELASGRRQAEKDATPRRRHSPSTRCMVSRDTIKPDLSTSWYFWSSQHFADGDQCSTYPVAGAVLAKSMTFERGLFLPLHMASLSCFLESPVYGQRFRASRSCTMIGLPPGQARRAWHAAIQASRAARSGSRDCRVSIRTWPAKGWQRRSRKPSSSAS